jgi:short-subunit dehydrogenase
MAGLRRIVVIGATSVIAEHCCRLWLEQAPADLLLVARDPARTERIAADLRVRSPASRIAVRTVDFLDAAAIGALASDAVKDGPIDIAMIAHGWLADQGKAQSDLAFCREVLEVNAVSPALFAEAFAGLMEKAGRGTLVIIGSVAGDRGRAVNYAYGASKGFIERYAQGLDHRLAPKGVRVVLAKPGPTDTPMAADHKAAGRKLASPQEVAERMVKAIDRGTFEVYAPARWRLIMLIVRNLPRLIFNRLKI